MSSALSFTPRHLSCAVLAVAGVASASLAHADVIGYLENSGVYFGVTNVGGALTGGGSFTNVSQFTAANYRGAEEGFFAAVNGAGAMNYYAAAGGGYFGATPATALAFGPLNGQSIGNNANYIGAADNLLYYKSATGVAAYLAATGANFANYTWANFSGGGDLSGQAIGRGVGLKDLGGNTDISDGFMMYVQSGGNLGYYSMATGAAATFAGFGGWTTFTSGALAGLTLNALNASPTGTVGTTSYRYLGEYNKGLFFDVNVAAVPEPSALLLSAVGAVFLMGAVRRRRVV
jgi:hypothetical protein